MRLALAFFALLSSVSSSVSEDMFELLGEDYAIIWEGYSDIDSCAGEEDTHDLGPYLIVCDQGDYEYPYHYGDVKILGTTIVYQGRNVNFFYICMEGQEVCPRVSVYKR